MCVFYGFFSHSGGLSPGAMGSNGLRGLASAAGLSWLPWMNRAQRSVVPRHAEPVAASTASTVPEMGGFLQFFMGKSPFLMGKAQFLMGKSTISMAIFIGILNNMAIEIMDLPIESSDFP